MGLFDSLFGGMESKAKFSAADAFAGILFGASACDGHIAEDEMQGLVTCLLRMKLYQRFDSKHFKQMLDKLHGYMKKNGVDALIDICAQTLPKELNKTAFTNACDIVLADGIIDPSEKEFIGRLQGKLGIDNGTAKAIAQVMVIKNKG